MGGGREPSQSLHHSMIEYVYVHVPYLGAEESSGGGLLGGHRGSGLNGGLGHGLGRGLGSGLSSLRQHTKEEGGSGGG